jgi:hypothetical protein
VGGETLKLFLSGLIQITCTKGHLKPELFLGSRRGKGWEESVGVQGVRGGDHFWGVEKRPGIVRALYHF